MLDPISTSNNKNPNKLINPLHSYLGKLLSAWATSLCFQCKLPSRIAGVKKYGFLELGFGSREKKVFGVWFKREEGIWGFGSVQERIRDLGGLVQKEKKGFRGLVQDRGRDFG